MLALFLPRRVRLQFKVCVLLCLLLGALGLRSCTESAPAAPTCSVTAPAAQRPVALLPVALRLPFPSGRWVRVLDTSRTGGPAHLLRKASPRSRWLPGQPAYLPQLHRRPKQSFLDSLADAARRRV